MVKLSLIIAAVFIFGTGFFVKIANQFTSAANIINNLLKSDDWMIKMVGKTAILFSHPLMLAISSIFIIYFIISKTIYG